MYVCVCDSEGKFWAPDACVCLCMYVCVCDSEGTFWAPDACVFYVHARVCVCVSKGTLWASDVVYERVCM